MGSASIGLWEKCNVKADIHGDKGDEDQEDGGGQLHFLAGEDGGHHQHDGQVHSNGIAKQVFAKEDGDKGDEEQEDGGEVGGQQFHGNLPLQYYWHDHQLLASEQSQVLDRKHCQVSVLVQKFQKLFGSALLVFH